VYTDGLLADEQAFADLPVRAALGKLDQDLSFAPAEPERVARWRLGRANESPSQARSILGR
jgi:hypothetical protein